VAGYRLSPQNVLDASNSQYEAFAVTVQRSPACPNQRDQSRDGELHLAVAGMSPCGDMLADGKPDLHQV